jgi:hypothetical protein
MTDNTLLTLSAIGIPPYSARGLKQTLTPINAATQLRRTVNGALTDVADPLFRKYASIITGGDVDPPAVDMVWPGRTLVVGCIVELSVQDSETDPPTLGRSVVSGSQRTADGFIFYRPLLTMKVISWNIADDEWPADVTWSLNLEEV